MASFPSTGLRPSHTALPPAVVAVPPSPRPFLSLEYNHHLRLMPSPSANCATWPSRSFPRCQSPGAHRPSPNYSPVVATQPSPLLPPGHAHYAHAAHLVATTTWLSPQPQIAPHGHPTNCGHMTPEYVDPTNCGCTHGYAHYAQTIASPDYALLSGFPPEDAHHHADYASP